MTKYGVSPWIDGFPRTRVPSFPRHRGDEPRPVIIIGGGLTGCVAAYVFAAAGVKVTLLEADRIGVGHTSSGLGWIAGEPGVSISEVEKALGRRLASAAFKSWRRAALDFQTLLKRLDIKCQLEAGGAVTAALTREQSARLQKEQKSRRSAGLDMPLVNARALKSDHALDALNGVRDKDAATLDPYRACLGFAAAAAARGAEIFERSPVRRTTFTRRNATVVTSGGSIKTARILVATGMPTSLFASLQRHFWFRTSHLVVTEPVPAKIRKGLGNRSGILRDCAEPPHLIRWLGDDRLLVSGADGPEQPPRPGHKVAIQRTGQLMYELSTLYPEISGLQAAYGWPHNYARTTDGLPYIGAHRNFPHHLFAFGDSSHSVTGAFLASRMLLRRHLDESDPAADAFAFTRYER